MKFLLACRLCLPTTLLAFGWVVGQSQAQTPPGSATTAKDKPFEYDPAIIFSYGLNDYASLDMAEARANRELGTCKIQIETAKNTINSTRNGGLFKGTGGTEVIARANQEIRSAYNTAANAQKALAIIAAKRKEWELIKASSNLMTLQSTQGSTVKAYIVRSDNDTLTIATEQGKVFQIDWDQLSDKSRLEVKNIASQPKPVVPGTTQRKPISYPYTSPDNINRKSLIDTYLAGQANIQVLKYLMGGDAFRFEPLYKFPENFKPATASWKDAKAQFYELLPALANNPWQKFNLRFIVEKKLTETRYLIRPQPSLGSEDYPLDPAILDALLGHFSETGEATLPVVCTDVQEITENGVKKNQLIYKEVLGGSNADYLKLKSAQFDLRYWMRQGLVPDSEIQQLRQDLIKLASDGDTRFHIAKEDVRWILLCPAVMIVLYDSTIYTE